MTDRLRRSVPERGPDHITDPVSQVPVVNIANILTMFRIVLVPVFLVVLFIDGGHETVWRIAAWAVFALAAITDRYDGRLARERGLITDFGKLADPIADKALIGAALVGLSALGDLWWWVTAVILAREIGITLLRFWVLRHGVIPASRGGKLKTLLQAIAIGLFILPLPQPLHWVAVGVMVAAIAVTIVTGFDYIWQALSLRAKGRAASVATGSGTTRSGTTPPRTGRSVQQVDAADQRGVPPTAPGFTGPDVAQPRAQGHRHP